MSDEFRAAEADSGWYNVATLKRVNEAQEEWRLKLHVAPESMSEEEWDRTVELLTELRDRAQIREGEDGKR